MARPTKSSESPAPGFNDIYEASPDPVSSRVNPTQTSPSPSPVGSDKENRAVHPPNDKGKGRVPMGPPRVPSQSGKRKRGTDRDTSNRAHRRRTAEADEGGITTDQYDPDQDIEERRRIRKGLRDLHKTLAENKREYLNPNSHGLRNTLLEANGFADQVKQTADATIDSKLLAQAADLTLARTVALVSGDTAQGVDVDDFIGKCINFMKNSDGAAEDDEAAPSSTQRRRRRNGEDEDDDGDQLNWAHLGRFACLKHNSRPSVPGFLLGPLSVEKKAKKIVVRRAALKHSQMQETRPEVVKAGEIEQSENNLSTLCQQILLRLVKVRKDAMRAVEEYTTDDLTDNEAQALMDRYSVNESGGIALFRFIINPYSFGQTVENMFYVSFLIKEGKIGIFDDERGLPYLALTEPGSKNDSSSGNGPAKHQAVLSLDMATWKKLIEVFNIREPMIRHREEEEHTNMGGKGWYH